MYTPGPWRTVPSDPGVVRAADGKWVGEFYSGTIRPVAERNANARLCAAAPAMLRELHRCVKDFEAKAIELGTRGLLDDADDLTLTAVRVKTLIFVVEQNQ